MTTNSVCIGIDIVLILLVLGYDIFYVANIFKGRKRESKCKVSGRNL